MPAEDLWETESDPPPTYEQDASDERFASQPRGRHARHSKTGPLRRISAPRHRRAQLLGLSIALGAVAAVLGVSAWLSGASPSMTTMVHPTAASLESIQSQGPTGQIVGIGDLCLADSKGGVANGNPVILATCTGTEQQQEWTLLANMEIVVNGRCLGVSPGTALAGLYACDKSASERWSVRSGHTIVSASSHLCLGSWKNKDSSGNLVWVTACQPTAKAQIWTVPSYAADPSGVAPPVGNMHGWRQAFTDDFTENVPVGQFPAAMSSTWGDYPDGWKDTTGNGTYEPTKVVSVHNGVMNLFLHTVNGTHMVAAPYPKIPGATGPDGGTTYGIYEVRFKAQRAVGYKTSWLLWPDSNDWSDGEIDFPEGYLNSSVTGYTHQLGASPATHETFHSSVLYGGWHTATVEWTTNSITFLLDGKVVGSSTNKAFIPDTPMHWVLQTETQTSGGPPSDTASSNVQIDWVAAWVPQQN